jgi:hypothetical protein
MDVSGQYHTLAALSPETKFRYHCIGGWVGPRAKLDILEKRELFRPAGIRALDSLVRSLVTVHITQSRVYYCYYYSYYIICVLLYDDIF